MVTAKASKPRLPGRATPLGASRGTVLLIQCTEPFPSNQCWKGGHQNQGGKMTELSVSTNLTTENKPPEKREGKEVKLSILRHRRAHTLLEAV